MHMHIMDLARGTYSSMHVLVGACLVPSEYGRAPNYPLHKRDHGIGACDGVCIGHASGMNQICIGVRIK